jgi:metal-sulfur cluster biosynthetic enzyme
VPPTSQRRIVATIVRSFAWCELTFENLDLRSSKRAVDPQIHHAIGETAVTMVTIKENANPIIHAVSKDTYSSSLSWETLLQAELDQSGDTAATRAIRQALNDSSSSPTTRTGTAGGNSLPWQQEHQQQQRRAPFCYWVGSSRTGAASAAENDDYGYRTKPEKNDAINGKEDAIHRDPLTADEVFEHIRSIQDPEHPLTLEQLGVVSRDQIEIVSSAISNYDTVRVRFTPTIPHCSMATLIGLSITVKLLRSLSPTTTKVTVSIEPGTHQSELSINKQLQDKERVCAALENKHLLAIVNKCIAAADVLRGGARVGHRAGWNYSS